MPWPKTPLHQADCRQTRFRPDIGAFEAAITGGDRTKGFFVAFAYTSDALGEFNAFFRKSAKVIVAVGVREMLDLDEELARKLV